MSDDRRLVYSTEQGRLAPARGKQKKRRPEPPAGGGVRVRREKKGRGGKEVTVVLGLSTAQHDLKAIAKQLKRSLGTGGSVKEGTIEIQGNRCDEVIALLAQAGITAKRSGG